MPICVSKPRLLQLYITSPGILLQIVVIWATNSNILQEANPLALYMSLSHRFSGILWLDSVLGTLILWQIDRGSVHSIHISSTVAWTCLGEATWLFRYYCTSATSSVYCRLLDICSSNFLIFSSRSKWLVMSLFGAISALISQSFLFDLRLSHCKYYLINSTLFLFIDWSRRFVWVDQGYCRYT